MANHTQLVEQGCKAANSKFKKHLEAVQSFYKTAHGRNLPENVEAVLGQCLTNTQAYFEGIAKKRGYLKTEGLTTSDLGTYIRHGFELISALIPSSILDDIVSVQPMDRKTGQVFWLDYQYETGQGIIRPGDTMFHAQKVTGLRNNGNAYKYFSSDIVQGEPIAAFGAIGTNYEHSFEHFPFKTGATVTVGYWDGAAVRTFTGTAAASSFTITDGVDTVTIVHDNTQAIGTFNVGVAFVPQTNALTVASYEFDFESRPANTGRVKLAIREAVVVAQKRQLAMNWLLDSAFELEQHYGKSIDDEAIAILAGELRAEIDQLVLDDIMAQAPASTLAGADRFLAANPVFISEMERAQDFVKHLQRESSQIYKTTRRIQGTWLGAGNEVCNLIMSMPNTMFKVENNGMQPPTGPHKVGRLMDRWDIYRNLAYGDNEYVMGAKGNSWIEAGYAWLPFIPIMVTDPYPVGNMEYERGVITKNAQTMLNDGFFVKSSIRWV